MASSYKGLASTREQPKVKNRKHNAFSASLPHHRPCQQVAKSAAASEGFVVALHARERWWWLVDGKRECKGAVDFIGFSRVACAPKMSTKSNGEAAG